ncbi:phage tail tip fiber protein [Escherichia coli]
MSQNVEFVLSLEDKQFTASIDRAGKLLTRFGEQATKPAQKINNLERSLGSVSRIIGVLESKLDATADKLQDVAAGFELVSDVSRKTRGNITSLNSGLKTLIERVDTTTSSVNKLTTSLRKVQSELNEFSDWATFAGKSASRFGTEVKEASTSVSGMNTRLNTTTKRLSNWGVTTNQAAEGLKKVRDQMDAVIGRQQLISKPVRVRTSGYGEGGGNGGGGRHSGSYGHGGRGAENGVFSGLRGNIFLLGEIGDAARTVTDILFGWQKPIVEAASKMERMRVMLRGLNKDKANPGKAAAEDMQYIVDMAQNAPFAMQALTDSFVKFRSAGLDPTDGSLKALVDSVARFGGDSELLKRAAVAVQQMSGKGVVSMEELRQQLGEAVPNAMKAMADAAGITMGELTKAVSSGTVEAKQALSLMFVGLRAENENSAKDMMQTYTGATAVTRFNRAARMGLAPIPSLIFAIRGAITGLKGAFAGLTAFIAANPIGAAFTVATVAVAGLITYMTMLRSETSKVVDEIRKIPEAMTPPDAPTALTAVGDYRNVILNWVNPDSIDLDHINVYASRANNLDTAKLIAEAASTTFTHAGLGDSETWFYWVRAANKRGMLSQPNSNLGTEAMTKDVLSFLTGKITSSELGQELLEEIDTKASQEAVDAINKQMEESLKSLDDKFTETDQRIEEAQNVLRTEVSNTASKVEEALKEVENSNAALIQLKETVSEQDKVVAGAVEAANAALDNSSALVAEEREARVEGDLANAKEIEAMKSTVDSSLATIEEMKKTVAEVEHSSAEVTTNIEALAKTNIDLALRQDEDQHKQMVSNARIATTQKAFADDMSAMATKMEEIRAEINEDIRASITEETTARVDADNAIGSRITKLESKINDDISAAIVSEQEARASADEALSKEVLSLQAKVEGDISAAISEEKNARATADESLAQQITTLKSQTGKDIKAAVAEETKARTDADSALASNITNLQAQTSKDIHAAITSEATARTSADNALSGRIDTLKASVDGNTATIQQQATAIADTNKKVSTAWTLKMETSTSGGQKYVAGIALGIDTTGLSQFLVQADRFGLVNSVNGKITTPFVIDAGVAYMNGAYIKNGTIDNAKIGNFIQSNDYSSGMTGWHINKNGNSEFNNVTVRGTVYATNGKFTGEIQATSGTFRGTVQADHFVGDVANMYVGNDFSVRYNGTYTMTYTDSSSSALPKNIYVAINVYTGGVGPVAAQFTCNGVTKTATTGKGTTYRDPDLNSTRSTGVGGTLYAAFNNVTSRTVAVTVKVTSSSQTHIYSPVMLISRGSGAFSMSGIS